MPGATAKTKVGAGARTALGSLEPLPVDEEHQEEGGEHEMEAVGVGVRPDRPGDWGEGQHDPGREGQPRASREAVDEDDAQARAGRKAERVEQVHPEGRLAERLEHHRRHPPEDHPRREARRVSGPQQRPDGLELAGVPERDARQQGRGRDEQGDQGGPGHSQDEPSVDPPPALKRHHPRRWPQATPQVTIPIESAMSA
jgi:hypothetical protein